MKETKTANILKPTKKDRGMALMISKLTTVEVYGLECYLAGIKAAKEAQEAAAEQTA